SSRRSGRRRALRRRAASLARARGGRAGHGLRRGASGERRGGRRKAPQRGERGLLRAPPAGAPSRGRALDLPGVGSPPAYPARYWSAYEHEVRSLSEYFEAVQKIAAFQTATDSRFVWRGVANSAWPLYSKLVRCYRDKYGVVPETEVALRGFEQSVLAEAR